MKKATPYEYFKRWTFCVVELWTFLTIFLILFLRNLDLIEFLWNWYGTPAHLVQNYLLLVEGIQGIFWASEMNPVLLLWHSEKLQPWLNASSPKGGSGVATGGGARGQSATPDSEKFAKNQEKEGKNREEKVKIGKVLYFAPPDRQGWLRYCRWAHSDISVYTVRKQQNMWKGVIFCSRIRKAGNTFWGLKCYFQEKGWVYSLKFFRLKNINPHPDWVAVGKVWKKKLSPEGGRKGWKKSVRSTVPGRGAGAPGTCHVLGESQ